jgi:transposase
MTWPPDLNLIKHAWAKLKELIYKLKPDLATLKGNNKELKIRFKYLIN